MLGGLALRHNLTLEQLEDLQLALDALLEFARRDGEIQVALEVEEGAVAAELGPFATERLRGELDRDPGDGSPGLARVLATVVDDVELADREGGTWVRLVKSVPIGSEAS